MSDSPPQLPTVPAASRRVWNMSPLAILIAVLMVVLVWGWIDMRRQLRSVRNEVTQRLHAADLDGRESRTIAKKAEVDAREATAKLTLLEERFADTRSKQASLDEQYLRLSRGSDEWLLSEVEQMLGIASQQLQLAGNVQGALVALQTAAARLGRTDPGGGDRTHLQSVRRAIDRDIGRLKLVPNLDIPGLTLRLDRIIETVDAMTLLADGRPKPLLDGRDGGETTWSRVSGLVWGEIRQLIRIQRLDRADQGLLSPEQSYFLRENLKLRLLSARVALLQRNEPTFRGDVGSSTTWLERYFDTRDAQVANAVIALGELNKSTVNVELPTLVESLTEVRRFKVALDKPQ